MKYFKLGYYKFIDLIGMALYTIGFRETGLDIILWTTKEITLIKHPEYKMIKYGKD